MTEEIKSSVGCSKCGSTNIHACPGAPIPPWTEEKKAELARVLAQYEVDDEDAEREKYWAGVKAGTHKARCRLGPRHHGVEVGADCDICTADVIDMMTHHDDEGPWVVSPDGHYVQSDDFRHDVSLKVIGDFFDDVVRKQYAEHIAAILNAGIKQRSTK